MTVNEEVLKAVERELATRRIEISRDLLLPIMTAALSAQPHRTVTKEMVSAGVWAILYGDFRVFPDRNSLFENCDLYKLAECVLAAALSSQPASAVAGLETVAKALAFAGRTEHDMSVDADEFWQHTVEDSRARYRCMAEAAMLAAAPQPPMPEVNGFTEAQLLARVAAVICEETCGLTSECKSREAASALLKNGYLATSQPSPQPVAVKPLEWGEGAPGTYTEVAESPFGYYSVWEINGTGCWSPWKAGAGTLAEGGLQGAKAAAQADYESRILSALTTPPADEWTKVVTRLTQERDEAREENERLKGLIRWAHDILVEINVSDYSHDDVCEQNDASVEVILGLAPALGETHGKTAEWWRGLANDAAEARMKVLEGDAAILLAQLDALQEATGYRLGGEDAALVDGIRATPLADQQENERLRERVKALEEALDAILHAVCGDTGFSSAALKGGESNE